ncbi:CRISPR-associated endonuclease Cas2 [Staphylococcus chromogenes]|uniref:CRISPR-associated endonuclease Cas2 n=1 Tax=Staphylococcus chromogenes TaxID=46126 RepID=UPI002888C552|nr:CRISPR-associated endonuclease Cas2 [Staphylococcus chromogenes]MDT0740573.1 CRISPR-associated endonuclease Cas2 [Staphylococcus chromogenes]
MYLLVSFDLSRETKLDRRKAYKYRNRLLELGFTMKQFSLYERQIRHSYKKDKLLDILKKELPDNGIITLYFLPDEVNNSQVTILGKHVKPVIIKDPQVIYL